MADKKVATITIKEVAELVAKTFESHGFDINMMKSTIEAQHYRNGGKPTGTIEVNFGERPAEGQAGFSQKSVTPSFEIYSKDFVEASFANPWDIWDAKLLTDVGVRLRVYYEHHSGGSNGFTRDYEITEHPNSTAKKPVRYLSAYR